MSLHNINIGSSGAIKSILLYQIMMENPNNNSKMLSFVPLDKNVAGFTSLQEAERAKKYLSTKYKINVSIIPNTHSIYKDINTFGAWKESNRRDRAPTIFVEKDFAGLDRIYIATQQLGDRLAFRGEYIDEQVAKSAVGECGEVRKLLIFDNANKFYRYFTRKQRETQLEQENIK